MRLLGGTGTSTSRRARSFDPAAASAGAAARDVESIGRAAEDVVGRAAGDVVGRAAAELTGRLSDAGGPTGVPPPCGAVRLVLVRLSPSPP